MEAKHNPKNDGFTISGDWSKQADALKEKFPQLTDSDLKFERGRENDLLKRMESRLNKKREEIMNIIRKTQPVTA